jgi:uncharacterized RDD family membrane protein YckC
MAKIIINPTSSSRREIALARTIVSIGRDPSNDVVLPDAMVSRRHAVIEYRGSQYFLRDCNSSNGSLVNGDRVSERNLRDGDLVAIGTARLLFREEMEDAGAKVVPHPSAPRQVCPTCQADYRKGDMFCKQCGTSLAPVAPARMVCTSCGTAVLLPARFCNACGQVLKDAPARGGDAESTKPPALENAPPGEGSASAPAAEARDAQGEQPAGAPEIAAADSAAAVSPESPEAGAAPPAECPARRRARVQQGRRAVAVPLAARAARRRTIVGAGRDGAALRDPLGTPEPERAAGAAGAASGARDRACEAGVAPPSPAGLGRRAVAGLLDGLVVTSAQLVLLSPVLYYWYENWWSHPPTTAEGVAFWPILLSLTLGPVVLALGAVYYVYHWGVKGATPGKRLLGLTVVAEDGSEPIGLSRAVVRVLGCLLSGLTLGIGFLMIAFGGSGLHDRLAGTRVVRRERG